MNDINEVRYVVSATESEGVDQILRLVSQSVQEEHWAFLPEANLWIETGLNETSTSQLSQVEVDTDHLSDLIVRYPQMHLYHFHPPVGKDPEVISILTPLAEIDTMGRISGTEALPGPADILASFEIAWLLEETRTEIDVRHFVVSRFGVVEFGPTQAGLREFGALRSHPQAYRHYDFATVASVRLGSHNVGRTLNQQRIQSLGELIHELGRQLSSTEYRVTFAPVDPTTLVVASP